ncbi:2Fe-2S iron-sulfur cluster binding domain-containing protein [Ramlibacter henchirensis]|uniref:2Fe-2S iron-sulfur cluster binding domain-containing protein n=1 Tax=Ramlibacter henchirensis TaxID=204072 RepID=A0A4Z0BM00_9BURK|nr:2Fe-2S iron-sulfur cluster-binding protein [Ramlibacter henchirensis]TFY99429.1 2Fe-2S iron-sulfur cluster binding domain-containing protein [Ramlibacter henchirensis]
MPYDIRIAGTDVQFPCEPGQNVLDAALKSGIEMPYSCRKGICGNCAGRVTAGSVECPPPGAAIEAGQHLFCQCLPLENLEIAPETWHRVDPSARKTYTVKVFRNTLAAPDVNVLQLRLPAGQRAKFRAGQYLQVTLPDGSRRSYSMANPPHESDMLQLHIRHVAGGQFTQLVPNLKSGDLLEVQLPFGDVEIHEEATGPLLCVAGGTGFAPVKSLIDDLMKKGARREVTLVWGARTTDGLYLMPAVERWKKSLPGFRFVPAVEDAAGAQAVGGFNGRADEAVRSLFTALADHDAYCCGAPAMVTAVRKACVEDRGLDPHRFHADVFVPGPAA